MKAARDLSNWWQGAGQPEEARGVLTMKQSICELVGKTISGVLMTEGNSGPQSQLFLFLSDGTYYEFYCVDSVIQGTSRVHSGTLEEVKKHVELRTSVLVCHTSL